MALKKTSKEAVKVEEKQLRDYELVLIINPEAEETVLETVVNNVSQFVTGKGGVTSEAERWGKRKLTYPIKHFLEGSYVVTRFKMSPVWSKELEASLQISEDVLRHLLIKVE